MTPPKSAAKPKRERQAPDALRRGAVGLESEFTLHVDGSPARPEAVFGDPRGFIRAPLMHRVGTSYHLPNSAAVYFDTGVIELATAAMEIERGCMARAGRSIWEAIGLVRAELDRWERRSRRSARLAGFSTHYNMSLSAGERRAISRPRLDALAHALTYVLPAPVMILATNRQSTGIGARPRPNRIEITADFTPDPSLMIATGSVILGVIREMMAWPSLTKAAVARQVPIISGFAPMRHTSRHGWLARYDCYPSNPFTCEIDGTHWTTTAGPLTLRDLARRIFQRFGRSIARVADPFSLRLVASVLTPGGASMLAASERPAAYDDVGRASVWSGERAADHLTRSRYERALMNAVAGRTLRLAGIPCTPIRVRGWSNVIFRRSDDGTTIAVPIDELVDRLDEWECG